MQQTRKQKLQSTPSSNTQREQNKKDQKNQGKNPKTQSEDNKTFERKKMPAVKKTKQNQEARTKDTRHNTTPQLELRIQISITNLIFYINACLFGYITYFLYKVFIS